MSDETSIKTGQTYSQYIGPPAIDKLNVACVLVNKAFGSTCYLVGSALRTRNFRDVDVRLMLSEGKANALFGPIENLAVYPFYDLLNLSITMYLRDMTGLPIDFQIQRRDWANKRYPGGSGRHPLGDISVLSKDQLPLWRTIDLPPDDEDTED